MATSTVAKLSLSRVPKISGAAQRRAAVSAAPRASSSLTFSSRSQLAKFKGKLHSQKCSRSVKARQLKSNTTAEAGDKTAVVFGATGYIGKFVVNELQARGYKTVAFARSKSGIGGKKSEDDVKADFPGVDVCFGDVSSTEGILEALPEKVDLVFSCMASRTGGVKDSWDIDYQATLNCLDAARAKGAEQFVLLSAICVQKPTLTFQKAKLKFEKALQEAGDIKYSIVRPTAFFKSLGGQVKSVSGGGPYVMFGDGCLAACKPISEVHPPSLPPSLHKPFQEMGLIQG
ncbi:hypothetical protein CYMTET_52363 [Cymbomonas tetramitiformis]|uniref:Divinyl chlorophyllide a 8-vinyl-reductase, chloroplastic n=1 Tax=Cymbomonas tetramitiformis TaxID=36881 RepID=A0AAE0BJD6_9CHLO|nr:hypothetical protein CYMTET_52363 [Cymbomonas tetramitiformis]